MKGCETEKRVKNESEREKDNLKSAGYAKGRETEKIKSEKLKEGEKEKIKKPKRAKKALKRAKKKKGARAKCPENA